MFHAIILSACFLSYFAWTHVAPIPGIDQIESSLDPLRLDPLSASSASLLPVIQITYQEGKKIAGMNGQAYAVPDQANVVMQPSGECISFSTFASNALNFSNSFSQNIAESSSSWFGFVQSSQSWTVAQALDFEFNSQNALGVAFCRVTTHQIQLEPIFLLTPDPDFVTGIKTLLSPNPQYEDNIDNWVEFFSSWGMAQPMNTIFGGLAGGIWGLQMGQFVAHGAHWASGQASASLAGFVNGAGGFAGNTNGASSEFLDFATNMSMWRGGTCIPGNGCEYSTWYNSLFSEPAALYTKWQPITPLLERIDPNITQGAQNAMQNISAIELLKSIIIPSLKKYASALQWVDPSTWWEPQCQYLQNNCTNCYFFDATNSINQLENTLEKTLIDAQTAVLINWISLNAWMNILSNFTQYSSMWISSGNSTLPVCESFSYHANPNYRSVSASIPAGLLEIRTTAAQKVNPAPGQLPLQDVAALSWQRFPTNADMYFENFESGPDATDYCSSLGPSWRVPSIWELAVFYQQGHASEVNISANPFWSSTTFQAAQVWLFDMNTGQSYTSPNIWSLDVWNGITCVRNLD